MNIPFYVRTYTVYYTYKIISYMTSICFDYDYRCKILNILYASLYNLN